MKSNKIDVDIFPRYTLNSVESDTSKYFDTSNHRLRIQINSSFSVKYSFATNSQIYEFRPLDFAHII